MKIHRFYIPREITLHSNNESSVLLPLSYLSNQVQKVLKLRAGEQIVLFNGNGNEYVSSIVSYPSKGEIEVKIENIQKNNVSFEKDVYLFFSLIKNDNTNWILQKGTELGVSHFIPLISARSEKKDLNIERASKILIEAAEQCGRGDVPIIHPVMKLDEVFENQSKSSNLTIAGLPQKMIVLEKGFSSIDKEKIKEKSIGLFIGPEGGWSEEEKKMFKEKGSEFCSLGPTVLRAETAAIVGAAKILQQ